MFQGRLFTTIHASCTSSRTHKKKKGKLCSFFCNVASNATADLFHCGFFLNAVDSSSCCCCCRRSSVGVHITLCNSMPSDHAASPFYMFFCCCKSIKTLFNVYILAVIMVNSFSCCHSR